MATFSNMSDADFQSALDKIAKSDGGRKEANALAKKLGFSDKGGILKQSEADFAGGIIYSQAQSGPIDNLINSAVSLNGFSTGGDNFLVTFQTTVSSALVPVAYCIALMFFLLALVDLGMSERMTLDSFVKFFARLAVGIFMIDNCQNFLNLGSAIADWMGNLINSNGSMGSGAGSAKNTFDMINSIMPDDGFARLQNGATVAMASAMQWIPLLLILTVLLSRLMEMCIRGALMPIAFSFVTEEGWRGTAIRYLKRYIALLAMGPLIKVVFEAGDWLTRGINASMAQNGALAAGAFFLSIGVNCAIGLAEVGMIKKLQSVVSEAFGA